MIIKKFFLLLGLTTLLFSTSCDSSDDDETIYGNWVSSATFDGSPRRGAASFVIETDTSETVYLGLGYNGSREGENYFSDFFSYTGGTSWMDQAPFPGLSRENAFAFSVDKKGYIGCGRNINQDESYLEDVWQFDPAADSASQWTQLPNFLGGKLAEMTSFVVGGKAYVVGGRSDSDDITKDCYEFDSELGTFTKIEGMSDKRYGGFSFVIGDRAYVGGGVSTSKIPVTFEYFNKNTKKWNDEGSLRDLYLRTDLTDDIAHYDDALDLTRSNAVTFVVGGKGYIASGLNANSGFLNDCWEYDTETDLWTQKTSFEYGMNARYMANSFVLDDLPYILLGHSTSAISTGYLDDMWYFEPDADEDEND